MEVNRRTLLFFLLTVLLQRPTFASKSSYVVYLGAYSNTSPQTQELKEEAHHEFLESILDNKEKARDAIFYSYTNYINGFAATLDDREVAEISKRPGVISVIPNIAHELHTTHSWEFLGLEENGTISDESLWKKARFGADTIIANIDTGVWPESKSFNDDGMGPIPSKWKGTCDAGDRCNRKLIGIRSFNKGFIAENGPLEPKYDTPVDTGGHGTHTLSTAAGRFVPSANIFGHANGTAKGGSPDARVAAYKVCWKSRGKDGCYDADILAAFDEAIRDGVDVISVSLGRKYAVDLFEDAAAIGSFHAAKNGISVVCSAGNTGKPGWVGNIAPWITTVAASTFDREFPTYLALGNRLHITGQSLSGKGLRAFKPLISGGDAAFSKGDLPAKLCLPGTLDPKKVKGKIVVCSSRNIGNIDKGLVVRDAGGVGMVLANDKDTGNRLDTETHVLPAVHISYSDGLTVYSYLDSNRSHYGYITNPKTKFGKKPSPIMASFSSQGPNYLIPGILKPDITAPGVHVIAAYTGAKSPLSNVFNDPHRYPFHIMSGTSMSCPHIAGIVGLLKTLHPDWSPSAIKSAIMTTATTRDNTKNPIKVYFSGEATAFNYGSGHVRPNRAMDPGLVYDLTPTDYLNFLCSVNYTSSQIATINGGPYTCPSTIPRVEDLNYPSIVVPTLDLNRPTTVSRLLKNVGSPGTYEARVEAPRGISVSVNPTTLSFEKIGEEKRFEVTVKTEGNDAKVGKYVFGALRWSDGIHYVRSPIVVGVGSYIP